MWTICHCSPNWIFNSIKWWSGPPIDTARTLALLKHNETEQKQEIDAAVKEEAEEEERETEMMRKKH